MFIKRNRIIQHNIESLGSIRQGLKIIDRKCSMDSKLFLPPLRVIDHNLYRVTAENRVSNKLVLSDRHKGRRL